MMETKEQPSQYDKITQNTELPEWLQEMSNPSSSPTTPTGETELPDWLAEGSGEAAATNRESDPGTGEMQALQGESGEPRVDADLPDWLAETPVPQAPAEVPDWLSDKKPEQYDASWVKQEYQPPAQAQSPVIEQTHNDDWLTARPQVPPLNYTPEPGQDRGPVDAIGAPIRGREEKPISFQDEGQPPIYFERLSIQAHERIRDNKAAIFNTEINRLFLQYLDQTDQNSAEAFLVKHQDQLPYLITHLSGLIHRNDTGFTPEERYEVQDQLYTIQALAIKAGLIRYNVENLGSVARSDIE
jgi:hypothetical protein